MKRKRKKKVMPHKPRRRKTKVVIGVLAGGCTNNIAITAMVYALPFLSHAPDHPFEYDFFPCEGVRPQELGRNKMCAYALEQLERDDDVLLMIDDDMIPAGNAGLETLKMLETPDYDIVGPLQLMFWSFDPVTKQGPQIYPCAGMFDQDAPNKIRPMTPVAGAMIAPVDWVGSGCMAIKRRVLADPRMHLAPDMDPPALWRNVYQENAVRISGLDINFCRRARALDYRIKVNWHAHVGHYKREDLNQVETYAQKMFARGVEIGEKRRGIHLDESESGPQEKPDRGTGPGFERNAELGQMEMDRPDEIEQAFG